jgi:hypothetical protein
VLWSLTRNTEVIDTSKEKLYTLASVQDWSDVIVPGFWTKSDLNDKENAKWVQI